MPDEQTPEPAEETAVELPTAKRGETVTHTVTVETKALTTSVLDDEEAENAFRGLYPNKKIDNVQMVSRVHNVGRNITYVYTGTIK